MTTKDLIRHIRLSAVLAAVLEVSGWPKPGNVHRSVDHPDARYEHFLAGSIALGSAVEEAALRGFRTGRGRLYISKIGLGRLVKKAVSDISKSHRGGNTHLGVCMLFIPLSAASGKIYAERGEILPDTLRNDVEMIMRSTTPLDAAEIYEAIAMVSSPHELGKVEGEGAPDLYDEQARSRIVERGISLFDIMREASSYDTVARELATGMKISFKIGYDALTEAFNRTRDINVATVHTFLKILSRVPDTFIARKVGVKKTSDVRKAVEIGISETIWISETAEKILSLGGLTTEQGTSSLWEFDRKLHSLGKDYSPGTTADLTAATLMIAILCGLKF